MTTATDEFVQLTQRSQEAVTTAVRGWTETLQTYAGSITTGHPLPSTADTVAVVESWFDLAGRLLTEQRTVAIAAVTRGHDAVGALTDKVSAFTADATEKITAATQATPGTDKAPRARNGANRTA